MNGKANGFFGISRDLVSGKANGLFETVRDLRQGDPLLPLLFAIPF